MYGISLSYSQPLLRPLKLIAGVLCLSVLVACARPDPALTMSGPYDPNEATNRKFHRFNKALDRNLVRPAGKGYVDILPDDIETAVGRFAFNLSIPSAVVNNILQGNMKGAIQDTSRFVVNSTIGLGGLFDPATELNMPAGTDADFGQTLYVWGVPEGPYIELPILGPATHRRAVGKVVDIFTNPITYVLEKPLNYISTATALAARLGERGRYSNTVDQILYESADGYAQAQSLYYQNRRFKLGSKSNDAYIDPYDDLASDPYEALNDE
ncbi:Hopanoid-associated MlaC-like outer-membrane-phospholipid-binding lipoprotein [hydrothermal vent metagenome]|uniref:Hopanoid-associated MlaC-like outer-membrane-phospholipid-binding lipoprotein n=1 Tax=hydrothermal vent metagenome TaxID=652676 RepID=A0A3B0SFA9_9ZZZZ